MAGVFNSRDDLLAALEEFATMLDERGERVKVEIVGGCAIAFFVDRSATRDIDAVIYPNESPVVAEVIAELAVRYNWPADWLNSKATMFFSDFPPPDDQWQSVVERGSVRIVVAPPELLLAMKMRAGRIIRDLDDISALVRLCGVTSTADAIAVFDRFFPMDEPRPRSIAYLDNLFGNAPA